MAEIGVRRLDLTDMDAAARVHRVSFDDRLSWLAGLHTPEEDRRFYRTQVFRSCDIWGAVDGTDLVGIIAFRPLWSDQLYVMPSAQGRGIGSRLLEIACADQPSVSLWTFQRNARARRFYEARGFIAIQETDGAGNEEREPDVLYRWTRS
jgi:GNAT superfamily N-acetyltransferase